MRFLLLLAVALVSSCTPSPPPAPVAINLKAPQFDYKNATELLISKNDPGTQDHWTARIVRDGAPSPENENSWTIEMGPDETQSGDNKAHGTFILHLLDTIRSLPLKVPSVSGTLESFGLTTPLFALKWKVDQAEYEMKIGAPVDSTGNSASDKGFQGLYVIFPPQTQVLIANGATLEMLNMIATFQNLRLPTLATFTSDDVDEIQIGQRSAKSFYAQREGSDWTNAKHRPIKKDVDTFLEQLTHLRIQKFIDDPKQQAPLRKKLALPKTLSLTFKDRKGTPTTIRVAQIGEGTYATISTRARKGEKGEPILSVFEIYPQFISEIAKLTL